MLHRRRLIGLLVTLLMLVVAAACGQKPGVAERFPVGIGGVGGSLQVDPETGNVINTETGEIIDPETGEVIGTVDEGGTGSDFSSGSGTGSGGTTGSDAGDGGTGGGSGGGTTTGGDEPTGGSADGVTNDVIKIGIHAPLSGAVPVPSDSVEKGKDLYYRWMADHNQSLFGRRVEVVLKNDQYNPSTAVAVCKEMVEKDKVFMLSGAAGTDQIKACAQYAESVGVPYVGAGVTEIGLSAFRTYFASTMTYPGQGPLLADFMANKLGAKGEKNGMLFFDTASFNDAHDAFKSAAASTGIPIDYDRRVSKNAGAQDARQVVQEMKLAGIENVYVLTSPVFLIQVWKQANAQVYDPQWVGVGISMTFDTVLTASCPDGPAADGAQFFSPFPAWSEVNKYDPEFTEAVNQFHPEKRGGDDFMILAWSGSKTIWEMLKLPGENLTRERFIYFVERARGLKNGMGPTLNFAPDDHFGADEVHLDRATCSDRRWHTIEDFISDF